MKGRIDSTSRVRWEQLSLCYAPSPLVIDQVILACYVKLPAILDLVQIDRHRVVPKREATRCFYAEEDDQ